MVNTHHYVCVSHSVVSNSSVTSWTVAIEAPLSVRFPRQEYWSALSFPPLGDLPKPGIKPGSLMSPALSGRFFTTRTTWEAHVMLVTSSHMPLHHPRTALNTGFQEPSKPLQRFIGDNHEVKSTLSIQENVNISSSMLSCESHHFEF